jgi:hypothetical protein
MDATEQMIAKIDRQLKLIDRGERLVWQAIAILEN